MVGQLSQVVGLRRFSTMPDKKHKESGINQLSSQGRSHSIDHKQRKYAAVVSASLKQDAESLKQDAEENLKRLDETAEESCSMSSSAEPAGSNLNRFLEYTTPAVQLQYLPKTCLWDNAMTRWTESCPFFTLGDLWDSFDEWSAYGAGVPLVLDGEENVVQYYVPYLSAIQIYSKRPLNFRKPFDESDASDNDSRDTSSETSSDGESDRISLHTRGQRCRNLWQIDYSSSFTEASRQMFHQRQQLHDDEENWDEERPGHLRFQYFEQALPYSRVPLVDKISDLSREFKELKQLRSIDLLPTSWMSIAWYPIYRIPMGPTLQDLAACFLTYHSLSTTTHDGRPTDEVTRTGSARLFDRSFNERKVEKITLQPFGLASYKLRGAFWTSVGTSERRLASDLQMSADAWLKQLQVRHPDFEFFVSHNV